MTGLSKGWATHAITALGLAAIVGGFLIAMAVSSAGPVYVARLGLGDAYVPLTDALAGEPGVLRIAGRVSTGTPLVVLTLEPAADRTAVERIVKSFAVNVEIHQQ